MKKIFFLVSALALTLSAKAEVVDLTLDANCFHQNNLGGGEWYMSFNSTYYDFMIDLYPEGGEIVSGAVYTLDQMDPEYSFGIDYSIYEQVVYESATYTENVLAEGVKEIAIHIEATNGNTYNISGIFDLSEMPSLVEVPDYVEMKDCAITCTDMDYGYEEFPGLIGFDGSDVYLNGCGYVSYFFESNIKGTRQGNTLTFPAGQAVGIGTTGNYFLFGLDENLNNTDLVLNYDAEQQAYVAATDMYVGTGSSLGAYYEWVTDLVVIPMDPVAIETVKTETEATVAKRYIDGQFIISRNGRNYDVTGKAMK